MPLSVTSPARDSGVLSKPRVPIVRNSGRTRERQTRDCVRHCNMRALERTDDSFGLCDRSRRKVQESTDGKGVQEMEAWGGAQPEAPCALSPRFHAKTDKDAYCSMGGAARRTRLRFQRVCPQHVVKDLARNAARGPTPLYAPNTSPSRPGGAGSSDRGNGLGDDHRAPPTPSGELNFENDNSHSRVAESMKVTLTRGPVAKYATESAGAGKKVELMPSAEWYVTQDCTFWMERRCTRPNCKFFNGSSRGALLQAP